MVRRLLVLAALALLAPSTARADEDDEILVFIEGPPDVTLNVREPSGWRMVCTAPCGIRVDRHRTYAMKGKDLRGYTEVQFGDEAETTLVVRRLDDAPRTVGKGIAIGGSGLFGAWVAMIAVTWVSAMVDWFTVPCAWGATCASSTTRGLGEVTFHPVTVGVGVGGLGVALAGFAMWATAPRSSVEPRQVATTGPLFGFAW